MLRPEEWRLAILAASVRAVVLLLTTALDEALPDYDSSKFITPSSAAARVSYPVPEMPYHVAAPNLTIPSQPLGAGEPLGSQAAADGWPTGPLSSALLQGWLVWDSVFFADIEARGYVFEQYYAFFPVFPALLSMAPAGLFAVLALMLNAVASVASTVLLYRLGVCVLGDRQLAALACLFFVLNPATIFHAAAYTESAFTATTLASLYWLHCRGRLAPAVAAAAASCGLRSNGVVNAGYLGHFCLRRAVGAWPFSKVRALGYALLGIAAAVTAVCPLVAFQYAGYDTFCRFGSPSGSSSSGGSGGSGDAADRGRWPRPWCSSRVPYVYGFVQAEYWNVGFLRYWTLQQLPNFLLAAPVLLLSFAGLFEYGKSNGRHVLLRLGLTPSYKPQRGRPAAKHTAAGHTSHDPEGQATASRADGHSPAAWEGNGLRRRRDRAAAGGPPHAAGGPPHAAGGPPHAAGGPPHAAGGLVGAGNDASEGAAVAAAAAAAAAGGGTDSLGEDASGTGGCGGGDGGSGYLVPELAVFMYPWAFCLAVAVSSMHVQVATRFLLSACPPVYWYMAHLWLRAAGRPLGRGLRNHGCSEQSRAGNVGVTGQRGGDEWGGVGEGGGGPVGGRDGHAGGDGGGTRGGGGGRGGGDGVKAGEEGPRARARGGEEAVKEATAEALRGVDSSRVVGIGVSGQQHGLVVLGDEGQVLRPAKLWCDSESAEEARELSQKFGWTLVPSFTITKLLWLQRHEPEVFAATRCVLLPHDFINTWMTGRRVMECGDASGTGVLDVAGRRWDLDAMDAVDPRVRTLFPPLISSPEEVVGGLLPEVASELGLPAGVLVAPGSGDNAMSALGAGAAGDGATVMSLGTSGTIFAKSPTPILDPTGVICPFCDATGAYLPLLCTLNCTRVLEEVREGFGMSHEELTALAEREPPGCGGVTWLPYMIGERTPCWPHASGALLGLRPGSLRPGLVYRAAIEGATLSLLSGFRRMVAAGLRPSPQLRLVGGGARNGLWRQVVADAFQMEVLLPAEPDSAALGAALQAAAVVEGATVCEYVARHPPPLLDEVVRPNPVHREAYEEALQRFEQLGQKLFSNNNNSSSSSK
ncbi:hypothetical protein PLESTF_000150600 [Pleodorina starrii]|nr:hypothetical protein PLESTM_000033200 [Pleodorina starrii]GLC64337.1 hypothetical protein PLESTF_000150600 [Pleodorina starrii]